MQGYPVWHLGSPFYFSTYIAVVSDTSFLCEEQAGAGHYADTEAHCQVFHACVDDGEGGLSKHSFLCPVGTLFNQQTLYCDWGYNVDCSPPETPDRGTNARNLLYDPDRLVHRVVASRELATIPKWGPSFKISFDLKINSFGSDPDYEEYPAEWNGYSSVLAFKGNGGLDCCSHGDRVPVINLRQDGDLVFSHSVGEDTSHEFRYNIAELNQWYNIVVEQGPSEEDKVRDIFNTTKRSIDAKFMIYNRLRTDLQRCWHISDLILVIHYYCQRHSDTNKHDLFIN